MKVFVTGATGFIGSAIVQELLSHGHQVLGLARSEASATALRKAGAEVHLGDLEDLESLKRGAAASDGVIHAGFIHDFSNYAACCKTDQLAIEAIGATLAGSERPFAVTSGLALVRSSGLTTEADKASPPSASLPRVSEQTALPLAAKGIRVSVIRLPPSVHDVGDHGFVPALIEIARNKAVSAYIGNGENRWPAVHRLDAAHLFRLALEKGQAGSIFHAVGDQGVPTKEIATVIGKHLRLPVVSKTTQEAAEHFTWLAHFFGLNCPASAPETEKQLDWKPTHASLIADLEQGSYFKSLS